MGDMEMAKYWLCRSALDDVRNAVLDQMSLIALAELLETEGDTERASRYISFTWECNRKYSPRMRSWQIAPLLTAIEFTLHSSLFTLHSSLVAVANSSLFTLHSSLKECRMAGRKQETEGENT